MVVGLTPEMHERGCRGRETGGTKVFFHGGIKVITVIVDAGLTKRTHKHSCNANSGEGIMIEIEKGKKNLYDK